MKITMILTALALTVVPTLSLAECMHDKVKMSCADGMVFDGKTSACVPVTG